MKKSNSLLVHIGISFLFFCSLFFLFFIPLSSQKNTWNSYRILFLPITADDTEIVEKARETGLKGLISQRSIAYRFNNIENALYQDKNFTNKEDYKKWFLNEKDHLQYIYIPSKQVISHDFFKFLKSNYDFFYIEDHSNFSLFQFIVSILFFIIAFIFTQRKTMFTAAALPFVVFASLQKGILAISAAILMIYAIAFWVEAVGFYLKYTKEQLLTRIKKNPLLIFFPVVAIVIAKFNSNISLLLFVLAIVAGGSLTYLSEIVKFFINRKLDEDKLHKRIEPYAMNPKSIARFWDTSKLLVVSVSALLIIIFASLTLFFRNTKTMQVSTNSIVLPLPDYSVEKIGYSKENYNDLKKHKTIENLPDLASFISDEWILKTMPYRKLNSKSNEDAVSFTDYSEDENGKIVESNSITLEFNDEFVKEAIKHCSMSSIEDLLLRQNHFITVSYAAKHFPLNSFNFAAFIVAILTSLLPLIIIFMRVREK